MNETVGKKLLKGSLVGRTQVLDQILLLQCFGRLDHVFTASMARSTVVIEENRSLGNISLICRGQKWQRYYDGYGEENRKERGNNAASGRWRLLSKSRPIALPSVVTHIVIATQPNNILSGVLCLKFKG
mmetsp:Transcript_97829/g.273901  ORF Transcript_97829/g.273901 Transcript_97829/m.273901 type:complete len:129 (-) Transcript_97829:212-598(-)